MDLGVFLRNRRTIVRWIATPLVLIVAVHHSTRWYCTTVEARTARARATMEIIPDLVEGLDHARDALNQFAQGDSGDIQDLDLLLSEMADEHGFRLDEVRFLDAPAVKKGELPVRPLLVTGSGTLISIMRLFQILQRPHYLVAMESAQLELLPGWGDGDTYRGRFVLHYFEIRSTAQK